ncbi:(E2-independent) E3 ubiquitin-conjugating enzyme FATS [Oenanthe melanoleuca]|uniref:(E2-independent) E3 ubiquitin-conjugating enzyme FATS n=1 Tax=Oenanthe melanoleuca TaxID=2939378 RepID=UPI0024C14AE4|nr:(E2-independent) E3 ubiquitin-conjugating enzyme FATS [Oenanthe melanoleuca]
MCWQLLAVAVTSRVPGAGQRIPGMLRVPNPGMLRVPNPGMLRVPNPGMLRVPDTGMLRVPNPGMLQVPNPGMLRVPDPGMLRVPNPGMLQVPNPGMLRVPDPGMLRVPNPGMLRDSPPVTRVFCTVSCPARREPGPWGVTQKGWSPDGQRTCTGLQQESGVQGKSSPTKEQNSALISPAIIAQSGEGEPRGSQPSVPMQAPCPSPGSAIASSAFLVPPSRVEIQASSADTVSPPGCAGAQHSPRQQGGFASITVTARRVPGCPAELAPAPGAAQVSPTPRSVPALLQRWPPPHNQPPPKLPKPCPKLGEEPPEQLSEPGIKEDGVALQSSDGREEMSPSFIASVQLQLSQPSPNSIYYLDKSLSVCIDQPRAKCQKMYRSTLSLRLKCSLSGLTADGADGIANGEPMEGRAPGHVPGASGAPGTAHLSSGNWGIQKGRAKEGHRGTKHPLQSVFAPGLAASVDIPRGPRQAEAQQEDEQPGSHRGVFSLRIPHSSNEAGTPMLLGSRKRSSTTAPGSPPDPAPRETIAAATDGSSSRADPSKDTSSSKEIQAQGVLKPEMSVSSRVCSTKASSRILREENVRGQQQLLKSDCGFPGWRDRTKELEAQEERERARRVALSRVTLSRVSLPRGTLPRGTLPRPCSPAVTWPQFSSQPGKTPAAPRTLREALELHNPQFISRSQKRQKRLQLMVQLRRAQQREAAPGTPRALPRKLSTSSARRKKQFTIPDPLSDNLFKPKERVIPEKEMHMRSKRIYDNLPEVKKKQEEKQKRIIIQSNRLRVEMFKKQLLDQLLHRNTE